MINWEEIQEKIAAKWYNDIVGPILHTRDRIFRIIDYLPVLWNGFDFDYGFILRVLKHQIGRSRREFSVTWHGLSNNQKRILRDMTRAELLIQRLLGDDYCHKEWAKHFKKWPHKWESIPGSTNSRLKEYGAVKHRSSHKICQKWQKLVKKDWDELWQLLKDHIREWWD